MGVNSFTQLRHHPPATSSSGLYNNASSRSNTLSKRGAKDRKQDLFIFSTYLFNAFGSIRNQHINLNHWPAQQTFTMGRHLSISLKSLKHLSRTSSSKKSATANYTARDSLEDEKTALEPLNNPEPKKLPGPISVPETKRHTEPIPSAPRSPRPRAATAPERSFTDVQPKNPKNHLFKHHPQPAFLRALYKQVTSTFRSHRTGILAATTSSLAPRKSADTARKPRLPTVAFTVDPPSRPKTSLTSRHCPKLHLRHHTDRIDATTVFIMELTMTPDPAAPELHLHHGPWLGYQPTDYRFLDKPAFYLQYVPPSPVLRTPAQRVKLSDTLPDGYVFLHDELPNARIMDPVVEGLYGRLRFLRGTWEGRKKGGHVEEMEYLVGLKGEMERLVTETEGLYMGWCWWRGLVELDKGRRKRHRKLVAEKQGTWGRVRSLTV